MPKLVPIIEGDGEVTALPALLRRLLEVELDAHPQSLRWGIAKPKNAFGCGGLTGDKGKDEL